MATPFRTDRLSIDHVLATRSVSCAEATRDGGVVAFCVAEPVLGEDAVPHSQVMLVAEGGRSALTLEGLGQMTNPIWHSDGSQLLVEERTEGETSLVLFDIARRPSSLRAKRVGAVDAPGHISGSCRWRSPDGSHRVSCLARRALSPASDDAYQLGRFLVPASVFEIDISTSLTSSPDLSPNFRRMSPAGVQVWDYDFCTDGRLAIVASQASDEAAWYSAELMICQDGKTLTTIYSPERLQVGTGIPAPYVPRRAQLAKPRWSPNGSNLALIAGLWSDRGITAGDLLVITPDVSRRVLSLTDGMGLSATHLEWVDDDNLKIVAWLEGEQAILSACVSRHQVSVEWSGRAAFADRYCPRFSRSSGGALHVVKESPQAPREVWRFDGSRDRSSQWTQISHVQPDSGSVLLGHTSQIEWAAADGTKISGQLLEPPGKSTYPLPMVTFMHGGPVFLHQWLYLGWVEGPYALAMQLLAAAGFAVFMPNPRGSVGWGSSFADALLYQHGRLDLEDVLAGVRFCVDSGLADEQRLGIAGWSSAGYLAALATCLSRQFKAAAVGAGIADWRALHSGSSALWNLDSMLIPGDPYQPAGEHDARSPITQLQNAATPTLVVHGELDPYLPVHQAIAYHRALVEHGIATELVIYPGEGHAIQRRHNVVDVSHRLISWFSRWLDFTASEDIHG